MIAHRTLDDQIAISLLRERLMAPGARWFGGLALVLVVVGIAGLLSQLVARRTREIGIRMALGASRRSIRAMVVGRTILLTGLGLVIGLPLARIVAGVSRTGSLRLRRTTRRHSSSRRR